MQKYTFVEISLILQCQIISQGIRIRPENLWDFLNIHCVAKYQKIGGGPFGDIEKIAKKASQSRKNIAQKFWSRAKLGPMSFGFADLKKS